MERPPDFMLQKKPIKIWDVNVYNIINSKVIETMTNSKYLIGYSDKAIKTLVLILPKISGCGQKLNAKYGDKDNKNKLICFPINDEKLFEKY